MWDFMTCVLVQPASPYWADRWNVECAAMQADGSVLIEHHFENWFWDHDADLPTFDRLVVREIAERKVFAYGMDDIQKANADYLDRNWFSTIARMD
jgi:hypothetical protein